jgi:anti-anti-sigma factor
MFEASRPSPSRVPRELRLYAAGDLDIFDASTLRRSLRLHAVEGVVTMSLDLSDVTWVNASALGHLARTRSQMAEVLGIRLDLVAWSPAVQRMSERTRLCGALGRAA